MRIDLFGQEVPDPVKLPRSFGAPYKGSKNKVVKKLFNEGIIPNLRPTDKRILVDPFCGGLAVSHYASLTGWDARPSDFSSSLVDFLKLITETDYTRTAEFWSWVSQDDFFKNRKSLSPEKQLTLSTVWSFNNMEHAFIYGIGLSGFKRAKHDLVVDGLVSPETLLTDEEHRQVLEIPFDYANGGRSMARRVKIKHMLKQSLNCDASNLQIHHLERSDRLVDLSKSRLSTQCLDYKQALEDAPPNSVIYLDPPYSGTASYNHAYEYGDKAGITDFDHEEFWKLVREKSRTNSVFISEYDAPDDFEIVWTKERWSGTQRKIGAHATENLYKLKGS